jgi:hypothetical protein
MLVRRKGDMYHVYDGSHRLGAAHRIIEKAAKLKEKAKADLKEEEKRIMLIAEDIGTNGLLCAVMK